MRSNMATSAIAAVKFAHALARALSYQSSSNHAEEIVKECERTQELAQIQAVNHPPVLLASNLLHVLSGFQVSPRVLKFEGTRGTRPKQQ